MGNSIEKRQEIAAKKYTAYREFFTSEKGEEILSDLMRAGCFTSSTIGSTPYETYYNEGRRSLILQIIETAKLTPTQIKKMTTKIDEEDHYLI